MKPPICCICNKRIKNFENAGLVSFKKRSSDIEWEEKMEREGKVGHPPYADWFCKKHYEKANKLSYLPIHKALKQFDE
ncbi:MAG: hypothetical protein EU541_08155 [Promethearchaeota archaeon]|nr:MAG: hypothetical protein EU541_08155 [Candidatus Lokiarchaeota archaeon]